jgi:hypothetical protein
MSDDGQDGWQLAARAVVRTKPGHGLLGNDFPIGQSQSSPPASGNFPFVLVHLSILPFSDNKKVKTNSAVCSLNKTARFSATFAPGVAARPARCPPLCEASSAFTVSWSNYSADARASIDKTGPPRLPSHKA